MLTSFCATDAVAQSTEAALEQAQAEIATLQAEANELAAQYAAAWDELGRLEDGAAQIEARIAKNRGDVRRLQRILNRNAIDRYSTGSPATAIQAFDADSVMDAARRDELLDAIADREVRTLDAFRATSQDLAADLAALDLARSEQNALIEQLDANAEQIERRLLEVQAREDELERTYRAELEAQRREAERREAERREAERRAALERDEPDEPEPDAPDDSSTTTSSPDDDSDPPDPDDPSPPASGNLGVAICPIEGPVAFTDTWGDARSGGRSHEGVDLMSPAGTPNVAVTSGRIEQSYGSRQGNGVFLYGDNGNTYYYFHLSAYEGGERSVSQGEVIGYVGSTGASGANHTHFEIHPGGGGAVNPYPYVSQVC